MALFLAYHELKRTPALLEHAQMIHRELMGHLNHISPTIYVTSHFNTHLNCTVPEEEVRAQKIEDANDDEADEEPHGAFSREQKMEKNHSRDVIPRGNIHTTIMKHVERIQKLQGRLESIKSEKLDCFACFAHMCDDSRKIRKNRVKSRMIRTIGRAAGLSRALTSYRGLVSLLLFFKNWHISYSRILLCSHIFWH